MKKLLLLLILISTAATAQIVNIPDANFKNALLTTGVDANNDGNIQVSEALNILSMNVSNKNIYNIEGIQAFSNLVFIDAAQNHFTTIDVSGFADLERLSINDTPVVSANLDGLNSLEYLACKNTSLTSLDLSGFPNLYEVMAGGSLLTEINFSGCSNLVGVDLADTPLVSANFTGCSLLYVLMLDQTMLTNLDISGLPSLNIVSFENTPLVSLDASYCTSLNGFTVNSPTLTQLNVTGCTAMTGLVLTGTALTSLDVSTLTNLQWLGCAETPITSLDLSQNTHLTGFDVWNCLDLHHLNMRNGLAQDWAIGNNPALAYICADENEVDAVQQYLSGAGSMPNTVVNSYCAFTPGGVYNTIEGTVRFDLAGDGCDQSDLTTRSIRVGINDGTFNGAAFTNDSGAYTFFVQALNLTIAPTLEQPTYFNVTPASATINATAIDGTTQSADFCLTPNGIHPDVEVIIAPLDQPRPGFDSQYEIIYRNKGNQTVSGQVLFGFDDTRLDFVNAAPAPNATSTGNLTFDYTALAPFETRSIAVTLNVNSPMEIPAVNIDDAFDFTATVVSNLTPDETPADNSTVLRQIVVGSYDPNDKHCLEGETVNPSQIGQYLHYIINFENTGTAAAENIVVKDVIDAAKFDLASLQMLSSSHAVQTRVNGNKVEFIFEQIQLEPNAHGHVIFKIKTKNTLAVNSSVSNKADIFFDYNFPIVTNTATTTFQLLATEDFTADQSVRVFPNPTSDRVNIESDSLIESVDLFDVNGRILSTRVGNQKQIDLSAQASGIYFLKVKTADGMKIEKVIKK